RAKDLVAVAQQAAHLVLDLQDPVAGFRLITAPGAGMTIVHKAAAARVSVFTHIEPFRFHLNGTRVFSL
ncbi:MAG TPA: hypothetical protein VK991_13800, partial [Halomonas sp.]|nr:hypothetical protein [Halomonas sp.]